MRIYEFKTRTLETMVICFNPSVFHVVKMKHGVILDQELAKNPYNSDVLATSLAKMHEKACSELGTTPVFDEKKIKSDLDADEMLYIYSMIAIERNTLITRSLSVQK
jgi:hypothetical protein